MAWKAVLFDMDGVLIDSEEYMAKTGVRALKKYGIDAKESDFAEFVGCGENRYVGGVAEKYGVPYRTEMKEYLYACYGEHVKEIFFIIVAKCSVKKFSASAISEFTLLIIVAVPALS